MSAIAIKSSDNVSSFDRAVITETSTRYESIQLTAAGISRQLRRRGRSSWKRGECGYDAELRLTILSCESRSMTAPARC